MGEGETTVIVILIICILIGLGIVIGSGINVEVTQKEIGKATELCKNDDGIFHISKDRLNEPYVICRDGSEIPLGKVE